MNVPYGTTPGAIVGITSLIWLGICALTAWLAYQAGGDNADIRWIQRNAAEIRRVQAQRAKERAAMFDPPPVPLVVPELERDDRTRDEVAYLRRQISRIEGIKQRRSGKVEW